MFAKYQEKFRQEMGEIHRRLDKFTAQVSNLDECVETVIDYAANLPELWGESDYKEKVRLQNLIFPEGMRYDKRNNECRTTAIKPTFLWMLCNTKSYGNKKSGIPELNLPYTTLVGNTGFEPVTSAV